MFTIFGGNGFIGSALVEYLRTKNIEVFVPEKDYQIESDVNLGHVIYCIGLTADFRTRLYDTVEAHVSYLNKILNGTRYESFVYLSSTRVYKRLKTNLATEEIDIPVNSNESDDLYNISKLMGESVCLSVPNNNVKVVRLSNVLGLDFQSENFFVSLVREAKQKGKIELNTGIHSSKDYILISDVIKILSKIHNGKERLYNLASGNNISTKEILDKMHQHLKFTVTENSNNDFSFPGISIQKLKSEFGFDPKNILNEVELIIKKYNNENNN